MSVSLRYSEVEPHHHLYHYGQYLQHQHHHHQQQQQQQCATATESATFYRTSSYNHRQHYCQSVPLSASPYLDYCNAAVPACSWRQLSDETTSTSHSQQRTYCSAGLSSWKTDGVNSMCYNSGRCVPEHGSPFDFQHVADTAAGWYVDDMNAQQLVNVPDSYQLSSSRSQSTSYSQHQAHVVCEPVSRTAQRSQVSEFQSSETSSQSHVDSGSSPPTGVRQRQLRRTKESLVPLIIRAILSSADVRMALYDICHYIKQNSVDYAKSDDDARWHNNVRHILSHYEFFIKCGRVPTGRGNYWTVHPVCRAAFAADDLRIKRARHAVQLYEKSINVTAARQHHATYTDQLHWLLALHQLLFYCKFFYGACSSVLKLIVTKL